MFTHLHLHTEYSLLDGLCHLPDLVSRARELGMTSLAITDHGAMYGAIDFYVLAKEAGLNPILGCEFYVAPGDRQGRDAGDKAAYHLVLLAQDKQGYQNLLQLTTKAHLEGFYYKPRVDRKLLAQHHQGLIALSACLQGEVAALLLQGRREEARQAAFWYREVFGNFYLELQEHDIPELHQVNQELVSLSRETGLPLVATNDVHYVRREDASAHEILLCLQTNTSIYDERRLKLADDSFYLKSETEMREAFASLPEALENTQRIAESCHLELDLHRRHLPQARVPPELSADDYLSQLCQEGLRRRYPQPSAEVQRRLTYELDVVRQTRFAHYFLVVWDLISFARQKGILFGVRGSAAASLILYCLGVTDIDPLAHRLVFERFLNPERREMPDIDLDFQDDRRHEVLGYVAQTYGAEQVAQIITFGTLGARAVLRDVGRALGMTYSDVDQVARLVPGTLNMTIDKALVENRELESIYLQDETVRKLIDTAKRLEGTARHASTHAAGVVISREPLAQHVPLQRPIRGSQEDILMTQYSMEAIARIGLLKMDFLGLGNLTILSRTRELITQTRGEVMDLQRLPLDNPKAYALLSAGETVGIFQLEGVGMRRYIRELKPSTFGEIAAMIALYRPGPMQHIPTFIRAKHGLEPPRYLHPALIPILEETYGIIVYQDQVLLIAQAFAGYTLGEADVVRKAMGKKIPEVMKKERKHFLEGARKKGFPENLANQVFDLIEPFAGYAFNKAHSVSYAMIAYQTAYLKANYPAEFMTALLIAHQGQAEKVATAVAECHRLNMPVLPPDINHSQADFALERQEGGKLAIRFGLAGIKNVGSSAVAPLLEARSQGGPFTSVEDLCQRADLKSLNRRALESLVKAGAFDSLARRGALLSHLDRLLSLAQREQQLRGSGQATMFDLWGEEVTTPLPGLNLPEEEALPQEKLAWEKELLGVYFSEHPFAEAARRLAATTTALCGQIDTEMEGQVVVVAGVAAQVRLLYTKDHRPFVSAALEDLSGTLDVTAWPETYQRTKELWVEGNILIVEGKVRVRQERVGLTCQSVRQYDPSATEAPRSVPPGEKEPPLPPPPPARARRLLLRLIPSGDETGDVNRLQEMQALLRQYPGPDRVQLVIARSDKVIRLEFPDTVSACPELKQRLADLVAVSVEEETL